MISLLKGPTIIFVGVLTNIAITQVQFPTVGLANLYNPSVEVLVGVQFILVTALSTISTVA